MLGQAQYASYRPDTFGATFRLPDSMVKRRYRALLSTEEDAGSVPASDVTAAGWGAGVGAHEEASDTRPPNHATV